MAGGGAAKIVNNKKENYKQNERGLGEIKSIKEKVIKRSNKASINLSKMQINPVLLSFVKQEHLLLKRTSAHHKRQVESMYSSY